MLLKVIGNVANACFVAFMATASFVFFCIGFKDMFMSWDDEAYIPVIVFISGLMFSVFGLGFLFLAVGAGFFRKKFWGL